jgi:hypothetical protein
MKHIHQLFRCLLLPLVAAVFCQCGAVGNLYTKATAKSRAKKQQAAMEAYSKMHKEQLDKSVGVDVVGEIVSVDLDSKFVMVRNMRVPGIQPEVNLDVKKGSGAKVRTCNTMKAGFIAADIVEGTPQRGEYLVVSKSQKDGTKNAAEKYMPKGVSEEEYWNIQRQSGLPAIAPLQSPEGNPAIPGLGTDILTVPAQPTATPAP